jgi:hypothetical protein
LEIQSLSEGYFFGENRQGSYAAKTLKANPDLDRSSIMGSGFLIPGRARRMHLKHAYIYFTVSVKSADRNYLGESAVDWRASPMSIWSSNTNALKSD